VKFFKAHITIDGPPEFINHFSQQNQEFLQDHPDLRNKAINFTTKTRDYLDIRPKKNDFKPSVNSTIERMQKIVDDVGSKLNSEKKKEKRVEF